MGLFGAPVASESLQGIYVIGPAASVAVETHEHAPEAPSGEVLTCVRLRRQRRTHQSSALWCANAKLEGLSSDKNK